MRLSKQINADITSRKMTPKEYCQKWLPHLYGIEYSDSGARKSCVFALMSALSLQYPTVNAWGSDFERYSNREKTELDLAKQDFINDVYHRSSHLAAQERT
jgi:hypothetical protein